jgi:hypothetical protein
MKAATDASDISLPRAAVEGHLQSGSTSANECNKNVGRPWYSLLATPMRNAIATKAWVLSKIGWHESGFSIMGAELMGG